MSDDPTDTSDAGSVAGRVDGRVEGGPGYLAIDLGPSRLTAGIVDVDGGIVLRDRVSTPPRNVWPALVQLVRRVLAANPSEVVPLAVGVSCPGPIDHGTGAMKPVGMPLWHDFPLRRELSTIIDLPVHIDTAGRGLALAELWQRSRAERRDDQSDGEQSNGDPADQHFATLALGDEVDGALVSHGVLLDGLTRNLGQFGHLIVEPDGVPCLCGAVGCLTSYAGARAIEATTGRELRRTPAARVESVGIMVGRACASIGALFDVSEIVIGGVVPEVLGPPFFDALDRELDQRSGLSHLADLRIRGVGSRQIGPLLGAAAIARATDDVTGREVSAGSGPLASELRPRLDRPSASSPVVSVPPALPSG